MANESRSSFPVQGDSALLERARLALRSLQLEEEAARYRAACAELLEAIADAEAGNKEPLKRWLLARRAGEIQDRRDAFASRVSEDELNLEPESVEEAVPRSLVESAESPIVSPWLDFEQAARERARAWFESEPSVEANAFASSLDLALQDSRNGTGTKRKTHARFLAANVGVSLLVHALMVLGLGWWVVTLSQPPKQLSLSASPYEQQEVSLETVLEQSPSDLAPSDEPEPVPQTQIESLALDVPQIAAIDSGFGPRIAESSMASLASSVGETGGLGSSLASGAEFFGAKAVGNKFVFVVDCSPSMARDKAFDSAKSEIIRSLSMLTPKQRFFVLFFGAEIVPIQFPGRKPEAYLLQASVENLTQTQQWVQRAKIQQDGRHPIDAVKHALDMQPDGIFLLFDGQTKVRNWTQRIRDMNLSDDLLSQGETKVPIHVVHFFLEEFSTDMKRLAIENGGTYRFIPRPKKEGER